MKIYAFGFNSGYECVIADSYKESWDRLSQDMRDYLEEYDESNCKVINVEDGVFMAYDIWGI